MKYYDNLFSFSDIFRRWVVATMLALTSVTVTAQMKAQVNVEASSEYFIWEENTPFGTARETGPRFRVGLSLRQPKEDGFLVGGRAEGYYGKVDYDSFTQTGNPLKTETEYLGALVEGQLIYRQRYHNNYSGDFVLGIGGDIWKRSLGGPLPYEEYWYVAYLKTGYEIGPHSDRGWIGGLGVKYPFYTAETVHFPFGDINLEPGKNPSAYLDVGYQFNKMFSLITYFDGYWFGRSDLVNGAYQPESKQFQIGIKGRMSF